MYKRLTNLLALTLISLPLCAMEKSQEQVTQQDAKTNSSWSTKKKILVGAGAVTAALAIYGGLHKVPAVVNGKEVADAAKTVRGGFSGAFKYAVRPVTVPVKFGWNWVALPAYDWVIKPTGKLAAKPFVASWDYAIKPACGYISSKLPAMATVKTGAAFVGTGVAGASIKPAYNFVFNGKKEDTKQLLQICADCFAGLVEKENLDKAQQDALKCTKDKELKSIVEKFFIALKADKKSEAQALGIQIREYIKQ